MTQTLVNCGDTVISMFAVSTSGLSQIWTKTWWRSYSPHTALVQVFAPTDLREDKVFLYTGFFKKLVLVCSCPVPHLSLCHILRFRVLTFCVLTLHYHLMLRNRELFFDIGEYFQNHPHPGTCPGRAQPCAERPSKEPFLECGCIPCLTVLVN